MRIRLYLNARLLDDVSVRGLCVGVCAIYGCKSHLGLQCRVIYIDIDHHIISLRKPRQLRFVYAPKKQRRRIAQRAIAEARARIER